MSIQKQANFQRTGPECVDLQGRSDRRQALNVGNRMSVLSQSALLASPDSSCNQEKNEHIFQLPQEPVLEEADVPRISASSTASCNPPQGCLTQDSLLRTIPRSSTRGAFVWRKLLSQGDNKIRQTPMETELINVTFPLNQLLKATHSRLAKKRQHLCSTKTARVQESLWELKPLTHWATGFTVQDCFHTARYQYLVLKI